MEEIDLRLTKWIPYSKGGERRNWYGNNDYVVNWTENKNFNRAKTTLKRLYLKPALTWPFITSGHFSARLLPSGFLWDVAGSPIFFTDENEKKYTLGFLCTNVANYYTKAVNPTLNVQAVDVAALPLIMSKGEQDAVINLVNDNLLLSTKDWDMSEISWNFSRHPLI